MTTKTEVLERALDLAKTGMPTDDAVRELLSCCGDKRVAVVLARREVVDEGGGSDATTQRACELLDEVLLRLPE